MGFCTRLFVSLALLFLPSSPEASDSRWLSHWCAEFKGSASPPVWEWLSSCFPLSSASSPAPFEPHEVQSALAALPRRRAPGWDSISSDVWRLLSLGLASEVTEFFNLLLQTGALPLLWRGGRL
eukprot:4284134-Prorocentrum_lima.AAC.1